VITCGSLRRKIRSQYLRTDSRLIIDLFSTVEKDDQSFEEEFIAITFGGASIRYWC